jgi:MarR family transcriptional regulator, organic hydroperoxide resistance regulator
MLFSSHHPRNLFHLDQKMKRAFDHQGYVPYLLRRIADTLIERFTAGLKPYGITLPMWRVLAVLHRRGGTRFGVLVSQTLIEPPTLSRLIAALRAKGFVSKSSSAVDARGVLISPTAKGLNLIERLTPHAFEVEKETLAGLTEDEAEMFRRLVRRVCANLAPFAPDDEGRN